LSSFLATAAARTAALMVERWSFTFSSPQQICGKLRPAMKNNREAVSSVALGNVQLSWSRGRLFGPAYIFCSLAVVIKKILSSNQNWNQLVQCGQKLWSSAAALKIQKQIFEPFYPASLMHNSRSSSRLCKEFVSSQTDCTWLGRQGYRRGGVGEGSTWELADFCNLQRPLVEWFAN
jgi:hypothetical protein